MKEKFNLESLKSAGILVLTLVFVFSLIVFFLTPKINELLLTQKKIVEQEEKIKVLSEKLLTLSSLSETELSNSALLLIDAIPAQKDFYGLLIKIKSVFQLENIPILSYSLNPGLLSSDSGKVAKVKGNNDNTMQILVSFSTSFDNVEKLINRLEKSLPLTTVESLSMKAEAASKSAQGTDLPVKMTVSGYYAPLPKQLGEVSASVPKVTSQNLSLLDKIKSFSRYDLEVLDSGTTVVVGKENPF